MKKTILTIVMTAVLCTALRAQNTRIATDTLPCGVRMPNYYYSAWYDTTEWYQYGSALDSIHVYNDGRDTYYFHWTPRLVGLGGINGAWPLHGDWTHVFQQYAPQPIRVKGIWAMVSQYAGHIMDRPDGGNYYPILDSTRLPEDFYLYLPDSGGDGASKTFLLNRIATVRWDTAQPKMMCLKYTLDTAFAGENAYCHVYEALFDKVYTIEGEFWIGGSQRSNTLISQPVGHVHQHFPSIYLVFGPNQKDRWYDQYAIRADGESPDGPFWVSENPFEDFGPFGVILDNQRYVEVSSNDTAGGVGRYSAYYPDSTYQTITAVPNRGYRFSHWNDGVTDNPRTIFVTCDTAFTAYFAPLPLYSLEVYSSNASYGYVTGSGAFYEGEEATIKALAHEGSHFWRWDDGNWSAYRHVTVTQDTSFTAIFIAEGDTGHVGIASVVGATFTLHPNPTDGEVRVETAGDAFPGGVLAVTDASGREVQRHELAPHTPGVRLDLSALPQGTYFVTLRTEEGSSTKKLVLK